MLYAVVAFVDSNEADWVPVKWIEQQDGTEVSDIRKLMEDGVQVKVYWPKICNPTAMSRARNHCIEREDDWTSYNARIWGTASM